MLKQHKSRDGSVGSGAANIYTITHSERHILLQLQRQTPRRVSLLKKRTVLPSGTRLFHWVPSKMGVQYSPVTGISSQQVLLLFQQLDIVRGCLRFVSFWCLCVGGPKK